MKVAPNRINKKIILNNSYSYHGYLVKSKKMTKIAKVCICNFEELLIFNEKRFFNCFCFDILKAKENN